MFARPFTVHSGHLVVPFSNTCVRENPDVIGHGLVLAIDPGVDWSPWESYLAEIGTAASKRFEALEAEGFAAAKLKVKAWANDLFTHGERRHRRHRVAAVDKSDGGELEL